MNEQHLRTNATTTPATTGDGPAAPMPPAKPTAAPMRSAAPAPMVPLTVPLADVPAILGASRAHLARMRASGKFGPTVLRWGGKLLVRREELERWVSAGMPNASDWEAMKAANGRRLKVVS